MKQLIQVFFRRRASTKTSERQMDSTHEITNLLRAWHEGNPEALDKLIPLVDFELKKMARKYMRGERHNHVLQATGLVNEAWMKLFKEKRVEWESRTHFYIFVARRMRQVLIDYADTHTAARAEHINITDAVIPREVSENLRLLDQALTKFAKIYPRAAMIVELRYFGGYTTEQVAEILDVGTATVERDSRFARSWLWREMTGKANE